MVCTFCLHTIFIDFWRKCVNFGYQWGTEHMGGQLIYWIFGGKRVICSSWGFWAIFQRKYNYQYTWDSHCYRGRSMSLHEVMSSFAYPLACYVFKQEEETNFTTTCAHVPRCKPIRSNLCKTAKIIRPIDPCVSGGWPSWKCRLLTTYASRGSDLTPVNAGTRPQGSLPIQSPTSSKIGSLEVSGL